MSDKAVNSPHILVVDDDREIVEGFKIILEEEGFTFSGEYNGHSALSSLEKNDFDFAFIDGLLPGMDGFQLIAKMRETDKGPKLPIVMISGVFRASNHAREATEKFKLIDYLEKPVGPSKIIQILKNHFNNEYPGKSKVTQKTTADPNAPVFNDYFLYQQSKCPLQGSLENIPFPVLFHQIFERKKTGQLLIQNQRAKKLLSFDKGRIIALRSNIVNECLGQLLLTTGQITEESFKQTFELMKKTGQRQGDLLLQAGAITSLQLSESLKEQFENKLYNIFTWKTGAFQFKETSKLPPQHMDIQIHPYSMIKEGIKRNVAQQTVNKWLMPYTSSLIEATENCQDKMRRCGFTLKEVRFASELKGNEPLEEILVNPIKNKEAMKIFALTLIAIEAWRVSQPDRVGSSSSSLFTLDNVKEGAKSTLKAHTDHLLKGTQNQPEQQTLQDVAGTSSSIKQLDPQAIEEMALVSAMQRMTDEQKAYYKELYEFNKSLKDKNYFEIFDADQKELDKADIKKKFLNLAKHYHPDTIPHQEVPEIKKVADELFTLLGKARETITNDKKRAEYLDYLNGGGNEDATEEVAKILASEQHFYNGQTAARRKDWSTAAKHFEDAIDLNPNEGEFFAELGWAKFNMSGNDMVARQEAMENINKGLELAPKLANAYYYLGVIYKASDNLQKAAENFIAAVKTDKKHTKAKSEIHLLKMRKAQKDKEKNSKKSLLSFFNKNK